VPAGRLTVLSGPSGVGKGSVIAVVRRRHPEVWLSVSVTTRSPRPGEVDGVQYHFVTQAEFDRMVAAGELLEHATYAGSSYGTPRRPVQEQLARGVPALLEIELQGARQVRAAMPDAQLVFRGVGPFGVEPYDLVANLGEATAARLRELTLRLYAAAAAHSESVGMILADTKFEFGWHDGKLLWIDEALTPDSSRYWDASAWQPGAEPASFDKQFVRNWLDASGWDHESPPPELPADVVAGTLARYREAFRRITGREPEL